MPLYNNMGIQFYGFSLDGNEKIGPKREPESKSQSFIEPELHDGAFNIPVGGSGLGGFFSQGVDFEKAARTDLELINKYRSMALQPETEAAIDAVVNQAIVSSSEEPLVDIVLDRIKATKKVKEKVKQEFTKVLELLNFNKFGHDIFRRWYIDGRMYYQMIVDDKTDIANKEGIKELRLIDPRYIRKIRELEKERQGDMEIIKSIREYFLYKPKPKTGQVYGKDIRINPDAVAFVHSGLFDPVRGILLSHLHKAIKPHNQLRMLEDSLVIYRIARAPERRTFYIDVGNLPKTKAEEYLRAIMNRYRNRMVYDSTTGDIKDDRTHMSMLEDFWLPRREGGRGTEVSTLPGGQNLGDIVDVQYFQRRLYKSLNVPVSRLESDTAFQLGRSSEITRDELAFDKLVDRLRTRFSELFSEILRVQLRLKNIITEEEWNEWKDNIFYEYQMDSYFTELKELEMLEMRLNVAQQMEPYVEKWFSNKYIRQEILRQSDDVMDRIDQDNKIEAGEVVFPNPSVAHDEKPEEDPYTKFGGGGGGFNKGGPPQAGGKGEVIDSDVSAAKPAGVNMKKPEQKPGS
jgi:hypothetical protein